MDITTGTEAITWRGYCLDLITELKTNTMTANKALQRKMSKLGHIGFDVIEDNRSERLILAQMGIPDDYVTIEIKVETFYDEFQGFTVVVKDDTGWEIKGGYALSIRMGLKECEDEIREIVNGWDLEPYTKEDYLADRADDLRKENA
jgi:hypothetical protein